MEYYNKSKGANADNDLDQCLTMLELALPHFREAARIQSAMKNVDKANDALRLISQTEEIIRQIGIVKATTAATYRNG